MYQFFPRPDRYVGRCGALDAAVTEHRLGGAPAFLKGLRALFVADVHVRLGTTPAQLDALVERMAAARPDLLLLGGDYSDDARGAVRFFDALSALKPPLGGYGVLGNNDAEAWEGRLNELREAMARAGCALLVNESVRLDYNGGALYLGGVDEHRHGQPDDAGLYPEMPRADAYRVLLSHYPILPENRPELMLSGHTHGGQFNLLGLTPFALGFERIFRPRLAPAAISGLHEIGNTRLLVSKGIGASRIQLRVGVRPEMNLLLFK